MKIIYLEGFMNTWLISGRLLSFLKLNYLETFKPQKMHILILFLAPSLGMKIESCPGLNWKKSALLRMP
jgi:hypothetical protein